MEPLQIGDRVGVILKLNEKKRECYFLGYGTYMGKSLVPEDAVGKKCKKFIKFHIPAGKIIMDDKNVYWDFQCWIMSEERFNKVFVNDCYDEGWEIIDIDIHGRKKESKNARK
jgi:hypothetical protein